jgi:hypothetical protein
MGSAEDFAGLLTGGGRVEGQRVDTVLEISDLRLMLVRVGGHVASIFVGHLVFSALIQPPPVLGIGGSDLRVCRVGGVAHPR